MRRATSFVFVAVFILGTLADDNNAQDTQEKTRPKITISKTTTRFTEPLNEQGEVDFLKAANRLLSQGVTAENNLVTAAIKLTGARTSDENAQKEMMRLLGIDTLPGENECLVEFRQFAQGSLVGEKLAETDNSVSSLPWSRTDFPVAAKWIDKYSPAVDTYIKQLEHKSRFYYPLVTETGEPKTLVNAQSHFSEGRTIARFLATRAMMHLGNNDITRAQTDILAIRKTANLTASSTTVMNMLIASAIKNIAHFAEMQMCFHEKTTLLHLESYAAELRDSCITADMRKTFDEYERMIILDYAIQIKNGQTAWPDESVDDNLKYNKIADKIDWDEVLKLLNQNVDSTVQRMALPNYRIQLTSLQIAGLESERGKIGPKVMRLPANPVKYSSLTESVVKVIEEQNYGPYNYYVLFEQYGNAPLTDALMQTNIALHRYRLDNGEFPKSLDLLKPKYLQSVPNDIYSNKPLLYKVKGEHIVLYSVGFNQKDDGGDVAAVNPTRKDIGIVSDPVEWERGFLFAF